MLDNFTELWCTNKSEADPNKKKYCGCCAKVSCKRISVGLPIFIAFLILQQTPFGWLFLNFLFPFIGIQEYSAVMGGILFFVHLKNKKYSALHLQLVEKLNNKWITLGLMISLHSTVLLLPAKYTGLALILVFILSIYIKMQQFNQVMKELTYLGNSYKQNPKAIQTTYDVEIELKIAQI